MYRKHIYSTILLLLNFIVLFNNSLSFYINKDILNTVDIHRDTKSLKTPILFKRESKVTNDDTNKSCNTNADCGNDYICINKICHIDYLNKECNIKEKGIGCPKPFHCKNNVCQLKRKGKYYTDTNHDTSDGNNFLLSDYGKIGAVCFVLFLFIVFFAVLHFAKRFNNGVEKENKQSEQNSQNNVNNQPNMLNPSEERNLYIRSMKEKRESNSINQDDDTYNKSAILDKLKTNDPYTTVNTKKDFDIAGNTYPITPQSNSTLINKSFSSTNNLIDKNRLSEKSSIYNSYYRKYSGGGISSLKDLSIYNASFQDFNTTNSYTYLSPSDNKGYISPFNICDSPPKSPAPTHIPPFNMCDSPPKSPAPAHRQSQSLSLPRKVSPIEPIPRGYYHRAYASTSNQIPFILEGDEDENNDDDNDDDDNLTTLSFDSGVLKVSSFKNKESIIYSYSEDLNASKECIIPSPETPTSSKKPMDN